MGLIRLVVVALAGAAGYLFLRRRQQGASRGSGGAVLGDGKAVLSDTASNLKSVAGEARARATNVVRNTLQSTREKADQVRSSGSFQGTPADTTSGEMGAAAPGAAQVDLPSESAVNRTLLSSSADVSPATTTSEQVYVHSPSTEISPAGSEGGDVLAKELVEDSDTRTEVYGGGDVGQDDAEATQGSASTTEGLLLTTDAGATPSDEAKFDDVLIEGGDLRNMDVATEPTSVSTGETITTVSTTRSSVRGGSNEGEESTTLGANEIVIRPSDDDSTDLRTTSTTPVTMTEGSSGVQAGPTPGMTGTEERMTTGSVADVSPESPGAAPPSDPDAIEIVPQGEITTEDYQRVEVSLPPETKEAIAQMEQGQSADWGRYDLPISEGYDVQATDGSVGTIDSVVREEEGAEPYMVVKKGMIFTSDVQIPFSAVDRVEGNTVFLNVEKQYMRMMEGKGDTPETGDPITRIQ